MEDICGECAYSGTFYLLSDMQTTYSGLVANCNIDAMNEELQEQGKELITTSPNQLTLELISNG